MMQAREGSSGSWGDSLYDQNREWSVPDVINIGS